MSKENFFFVFSNPEKIAELTFKDDPQSKGRMLLAFAFLLGGDKKTSLDKLLEGIHVENFEAYFNILVANGLAYKRVQLTSDYFYFSNDREWIEHMRTKECNCDYCHCGSYKIDVVDTTIPVNSPVYRQPIPPRSLDEVMECFYKLGKTKEEATDFWNHYESVGWYSGNQPIVNWRAKANMWSGDKFDKGSENISPKDESGGSKQKDFWTKEWD